jgi:hypothetical protein
VLSLVLVKGRALFEGAVQRKGDGRQLIIAQLMPPDRRYDLVTGALTRVAARRTLYNPRTKHRPRSTRMQINVLLTVVAGLLPQQHGRQTGWEGGGVATVRPLSS